jgi:serine/threonine protein kinase
VSQEVCPVRPGEIVGGKYRVERTLGAGGMGIVVAATQIELDRPVALKFLLPKVLERPGLVTRFSREARAAAKLESEHVARVLDVGTLESGAPYIVMEYLEGEDLASVVASRGALPFEQAVGYVLQACEALAEAHALGIIHRDLKPGNLFLANRTSGAPVVKVLDFGLSKFSNPGEENVTTESSFLGSPLYMSPEQLMSARTADARSDIWSLGVVLYELVTGHSPFQYERIAGLVAAILQKPPKPMDEWRRDVPSDLQAVVGRCLEKDPAQRFANVAQLARALGPFGPAGSARSVERVAHVLRRAEPSVEAAGTLPLPDAPLAANPPARPEPVGIVESVAGSSRSIREAPADATLASGPLNVRAQRRGRVRARVVVGIVATGVAALAGLVAVLAPTGETHRGLVAPSALVGPSALVVPSTLVVPSLLAGPRTAQPAQTPEESSLAPLAPPQALDSAGRAPLAPPPLSPPPPSAHPTSAESANRRPRVTPTIAFPAPAASASSAGSPSGPAPVAPDDPLRRLKTM